MTNHVSSARPNAGEGFTFGEFSCGGCLGSPNVGWIHWGTASPTKGISYANEKDVDFGVSRVVLSRNRERPGPQLALSLRTRRRNVAPVS